MSDQSTTTRIDSKHGLPSQPYPDIGISAKMYVERMNDYFELQVELGNTSMNKDGVKQLTFLNNITAAPGNSLQLYRKRMKDMNQAITYDDLVNEFKRSNTNLAEQENIMTTLTYRLRPDTSIYQHEEAVNKHVQKFNELYNQLEDTRDDARMRDAFLHSLHPALTSQVKSLLVSQQKSYDKATLFDVQQLAIANANAVQDKWIQYRSNARDRQSGVKRPYQPPASLQTRVSHIQNAYSNEHDNSSSNSNTSSVNTINYQPQRSNNKQLIDMIMKYCEAHNLCKWCKQVKHLPDGERCYKVKQPARIDNNELMSFAQSRGITLNMRGRQN
jgi:hypothetical protein